MHHLLKEGELCNFKFKGATFFDAAYLVDGWTTVEWLGILGKYYDQDVEKSLGHYREFPKNDVFKVRMSCTYCFRKDVFDAMELVPVSYTHLRAHETPEHLVCRLLLEKKIVR